MGNDVDHVCDKRNFNLYYFWYFSKTFLMSQNVKAFFAETDQINKMFPNLSNIFDI